MAIISDAHEGLATMVGERGLHEDGSGGVAFRYKMLGNIDMMAAMGSSVVDYEIAELYPGGKVGSHVHTRTEELFYVLTGRAAIGLGDDVVEVAAGDVILTGLHGIQSVDVLGDETYRMVIIQALPPEILEAERQSRGAAA